MLELDDPHWAELRHAYGYGFDTPLLLARLCNSSSSLGRDEPWFTLWSSLAHQGDVYPASFAAVPHVVRVLAKNPAMSDHSFFQFPAWVEICRQKKRIPVPDFLSDDYFSSLRQLPTLVASAASRDWDDGFLSCALSALAAAKGYGVIAEAVLELNTQTAKEFLKWFHEK